MFSIMNMIFKVGEISVGKKLLLSQKTGTLPEMPEDIILLYELCWLHATCTSRPQGVHHPFISCSDSIIIHPCPCYVIIHRGCNNHEHSLPGRIQLSFMAEGRDINFEATVKSAFGEVLFGVELQRLNTVLKSKIVNIINKPIRKQRSLYLLNRPFITKYIFISYLL